MTQESFDHLEQKGHNRQNDYRFANVQSKRVVGHGTETYHILIGTRALLSKEVVAVFFFKKRCFLHSIFIASIIALIIVD